MKKILFFTLCLSFLALKISSQEARPLSNFPTQNQEQIHLEYSAGKNYILTERTDLRRYDNGKYTGLLSRELRSFISPSKIQKDFTFYEGDFYVWQETRLNSNQVKPGIHNSIESKFKIFSDGTLTMIEDNGYPSFRSFPSYPKENLKIGDVWHANAERSVDPKNSGVFTKMPIYIEYKFLREDKYNEEDVYILSAKWASRYGKNYIDPTGDSSLKSASGTHNANIIVSKTNGRSILIRDLVDETFFYDSGESISFKGTISLFTEYPPAYNSEEIFESLQTIVRSQNENSTNEQSSNTLINSESLENSAQSTVQSLVQTNEHLLVEQTNAGLKLTMQNLLFKANSAELLPEENERLDEICSVLKNVKNQFFLVEGHTARIGDESNEKELSLKRAHTIANEMVKRGISAQNIICKGSGGTKPLATNSTAEGRAKNRRVEITILN